MKKAICLFCLIFFAVLPTYSFADSVLRPYDYQIITPDGKYVLVMLSKDGSDVKIRKRHPVSGLYSNNENAKLIWKLAKEPAWTTTEQNVFLSSDNRHLVIMGPWPSMLGEASQELQQTAILFLEDGRVVKSYQIGDFVSDRSGLPETVSHFSWLRWESLLFDDAAKQLSLMTQENKKFVLNIINGEIINK